jgi:hypothetical protein
MAETWKPSRVPLKVICSCKVEDSDITYVVPVSPDTQSCYEAKVKLEAKLGKKVVDCEMEWFGWDYW